MWKVQSTCLPLEVCDGMAIQESQGLTGRTVKMPGDTETVVWENMNRGRRKSESSMMESDSDCGKVIVGMISSDVRGTKKIPARVFVISQLC